MGDTLKKVQPCDPLAIPAATFNTFVYAAQDFLRRHGSIGRTPAADRPPFDTVLLKNASRTDRGRFEVLGIDGPVFTPTDSLETFTNGIALAGVTPRARRSRIAKRGWEYPPAPRLRRAGIWVRPEGPSRWDATPTPRTEAPIAVTRGWRPPAAAKSPTLQSHGDGAAIVKVPVAAYVEKVCEERNFSLLGIAT